MQTSNCLSKALSVEILKHDDQRFQNCHALIQNSLATIASAQLANDLSVHLNQAREMEATPPHHPAPPSLHPAQAVLPGKGPAKLNMTERINIS